MTALGVSKNQGTLDSRWHRRVGRLHDDPDRQLRAQELLERKPALQRVRDHLLVARRRQCALHRDEDHRAEEGSPTDASSRLWTVSIRPLVVRGPSTLA